MLLNVFDLTGIRVFNLVWPLGSALLLERGDNIRNCLDVTFEFLCGMLGDMTMTYINLLLCGSVTKQCDCLLYWIFWNMNDWEWKRKAIPLHFNCVSQLPIFITHKVLGPAGVRVRTDDVIESGRRYVWRHATLSYRTVDACVLNAAQLKFTVTAFF